MKKKIQIVLADDHDMVREGLVMLLNAEPDMVVIADAGDGRGAVRLTRELQPDVVVMDVSMPELNGVDATRQIMEALPGVRVICLSMHKQRQMISAALRAGAAGYLVKSCAGHELAEAIRMVVAGKSYISPEIAGDVVLEFLHGPKSKDGPFTALSEREREVLRLIAEGHSTKDIASGLHISDKTVAAHRLEIMEKLHLHSVADLTRYAIREGLVAP